MLKRLLLITIATLPLFGRSQAAPIEMVFPEGTYQSGSSLLSDDAPADRLDVNRDGRVSAIDALQVINRLAKKTLLLQDPPVGEAEAESKGMPMSLAIDAVITGGSESTDDTDDDLLRLLADDQARIEIGNMI